MAGSEELIMRPNEIADQWSRSSRVDASRHRSDEGNVFHERRMQAQFARTKPTDAISVIKGQSDSHARLRLRSPVRGIIAATDIHTGSKTVFDYFVKPLNRAREALRER